MAHDHDSNHEPYNPQGPSGFTQGLNIPVIFTTGAVSFLLLVSVLSATHGSYLWAQKSLQAQRQANPGGAALNVANVTTNDLRLQQKERISKYDWVNKDLSIARIPVDQAMNEIVSSAGKAKPVLPPDAQ